MSDLVFVLVLGSLVVDTLNGALLRADYFSVSMPYKILLVGLITVLCRCYRLMLVCATVAVLYIFAHIIQHQSLERVMTGVDWLMKFLVLPFFLVYFFRLARSNLGLIYLWRFAVFSFFVISGNILIGALGFGYAAYGGEGARLGAKGFIYAGNELALALVLSGAIIMQHLLERDRLREFLFFSGIFLVLAVLTAIKVAIGAALLLLVVFPCIHLLASYRKGVVSLRALILTAVVVVAAPAIIFGTVHFVLHYVGLWSRVEFFMSQHGFLTVILSQRDLRAEVAIAFFLHDYDLFRQLLGTGVDWMFASGLGGNIEMDPVDYLLRYGMVGVLATYAVLLAVLASTLRAALSDIRRLYSVTVQCLVIGISIAAGHVLYSAMSAPLLSAVMVLGLVGCRCDVSQLHIERRPLARTLR